MGVDDTIIETSEEELNLATSSCDGGNERVLCLGVEETDGKGLAIASSEACEESSDNDSNSTEDSEIVAEWEAVGSKDRVQVFLPSGCDKRSEFG